MRYLLGETQKNVKGVFLSIEGDENSHVGNGTYSKCITTPFTSDTLDWCCGDGYKFLHAHEGFLLKSNIQTKRKIQQKGLCKGNINTTFLLGSLVEILSIFVQTKQKKGNKNTQHQSNQGG